MCFRISINPGFYASLRTCVFPAGAGRKKRVLKWTAGHSHEGEFRNRKKNGKNRPKIKPSRPRPKNAENRRIEPNPFGLFAMSRGGMREIHGTQVRKVTRFLNVQMFYFIIFMQSGAVGARMGTRISIVVARPHGFRGGKTRRPPDFAYRDFRTDDSLAHYPTCPSMQGNSQWRPPTRGAVFSDGPTSRGQA